MRCRVAFCDHSPVFYEKFELLHLALAALKTAGKVDSGPGRQLPCCLECGFLRLPYYCLKNRITW